MNYSTYISSAIFAVAIVGSLAIKKAWMRIILYAVAYIALWLPPIIINPQLVVKENVIVAAGIVARFIILLALVSEGYHFFKKIWRKKN